MDGEEKVRILAWRQENVIMKKSSDVLRGQGYLWWPCWLLHVTYPKMSLLLPRLDLDDNQRPANTSKHTVDVRRQELGRKPHLSASELKEMHRERLHQMCRALPEKGPEDTKSMCCLQK